MQDKKEAIPQFLGLPAPVFKDAEAIVIPIPFEKTVSFLSGTAGGPRAILQATHQVELFDEETLLDFSCSAATCTADPVCCCSAGVKEYLKSVEESVRKCRGKFVVALGGEHTLSYGVVCGICDNPGQLTVVHLDAHSDLINRLEGRKWSHGTVMRRIHELGCCLIQIGIRSLAKEEYEFARDRERIKTFYAHRLEENWGEIIHLLKGLTGDVYLSMDMDVLDPSFMPSTGTPQPGGLSWWKLMEVIRAVAASGADWKGADIVEFIPSPVYRGMDMVPARLLAKAIAYRFSSPSRG